MTRTLAEIPPLVPNEAKASRQDTPTANTALKMPTGHAQATVNGNVVADATEWEVVEGNIYFPPSAIKADLFRKTDLHTTCHWKGEASYYAIAVGGTELENAAWYYPAPKEAAAHIKDHVAFYKSKVDVKSS